MPATPSQFSFAGEPASADPVSALKVEIGFDDVSGYRLSSSALRIDLAAKVLGGSGGLGFPRLDQATIRPVPQGVVVESPVMTVGFWRSEPGEEIEAATRSLYREIFQAVAGSSLYRVWHFVPRINACEGELENYRLFCRGRSEAFSSAFGRDSHHRLPAASAVGTEDTRLAALFVAGRPPPRHAENPEQVPAYRYPPLYGPRPPSFARASRVVIEGGELVFISGTASIKGSDTVFAGDCAGQVETTLHNLALIGEASGLGFDLGRARGAKKTVVVYVRREKDFPAVQHALAERLLGPGDQVVYLRSDICRSDLLVEIEASVFIPSRRSPQPG